MVILVIVVLQFLFLVSEFVVQYFQNKVAYWVPWLKQEISFHALYGKSMLWRRLQVLDWLTISLLMSVEKKGTCDKDISILWLFFNVLKRMIHILLIVAFL